MLLDDSGQLVEVAFVKITLKADEVQLHALLSCGDAEVVVDKAVRDKPLAFSEILNDLVGDTDLCRRSILVEGHDLAELFVDILRMHTDDDLILSARFHDLDNAGHTLDLLSDLVTRIFLEEQTQSRRTMCCTGDIRFAYSILNISSQFSIITYFSHDYLPSAFYNKKLEKLKQILALLNKRIKSIKEV